jgi:hypothetical protein
MSLLGNSVYRRPASRPYSNFGDPSGGCVLQRYLDELPFVVIDPDEGR